ncbi:hypothetical protein ISF_02647 [Cordyceps fumosorosea ARSEF 2679]|uniref:Uncharacterized protein n=1 Tax=Cordyceps fumosorosea (strain ARSEF 2679) TaxID=1081104 RepID=A0A168BXG5_CORFA|nr:hypothetical protein ISF_02647 [Cordyceps fumosorosea ARSEF 2679]OAA70673.1 hypothetical protein ISF_02647 [Cordyceps fumosorosea ARSEF 2679]
MFATQQYTEVIDAGRKRQRDEAELNNGPAGFSEHRAKRVQCLPVRTSSMMPMQQTMPSGMGEPDFSSNSNYTTWQNSNQIDQQMTAMDCVEIQPALPSHLQPDAATGRIPTPMQPSFADQFRGQQWANSNAATGRRGIVNMGHHQAGIADQPCIQCDASPNQDWQNMQSNRRLPSPISESEDCMSHSPGNSAALQAMEHPNAMMDIEIQRPAASSDDGEGDPDSPSSHRKGHTRSRHTVNTWTWQPGMKRSFSIGYRSDCDKCRDKVPGHFNHIIIS